MRQNNMNQEVSIYRYVTQGSFDAYLWQALETKARFIAQILTGDSTVRQAEDIGAQELCVLPTSPREFRFSIAYSHPS